MNENLILLAATLAAGWAVAIANLPRRLRHRQWWGPLLAVGYVLVVAIVALRGGEDWRPLAFALDPVSGVRWLEWLRDAIATAPTWVASSVAFVDRYVPLAVLVGFVLVKPVVVALMWLLPHHFATAPSTFAYVEGAEARQGRWTLRPQFTFARFAFGLAAMLSAIPVLLSVSGVPVPAWPVLLGILPVFAYVILSEFTWSLRGHDAVDAKAEAQAATERPPRDERPGLEALIGHYEAFDASFRSGRPTDRFDVRAFESSKSTVDARSSTAIAVGLTAAESPLLDALLEGRDVLVVDHLPYRFERVLRYTLEDAALRGRRILVLVEREEQLRSAVAWIERMLAGAYVRVADAGNVHALDAEVLVATVRRDLSQLLAAGWAAMPVLVLALDAHETVVWHGAHVRALRNELEDRSGRPVQFVALSDWRVDLEEAVRNIVGSDAYEFRPALERSAGAVLVWPTEASGGDGERLQDKVFAAIHSRLSAEVVLSYPTLAIADVPVYLVDQSTVPVQAAINEASNSVDHQRAEYASVGRLDADPRLRVGETDWDVEARDVDLAVAIVRDDSANLPWAVNEWAGLGAEGTLVHVVSPPYLYRDWFVAALGDHLSSRRKFSSFAPASISSPWSHAYLLYRRLERRFVALDDVRVALSQIEFLSGGTGATHAPDLGSFEGRLARVLESELALPPVEFEYEEGHDFDVHVGFRPVTKVRFTPAVRARPPSWLARIEIRGAETHVGPLLTLFRWELHQRFLPRQTHVFNGMVYELIQFDLASGVVHAESRSLRARYGEYRQLRSYCVDLAAARFGSVHRDLDPDASIPDYAVERFDVPVSVATRGYLAFHVEHGLDLDRADERHQLVPERVHERGKVLRLRVRTAGAIDNAELDRVAFTFALLLQESLRSYYPEAHPYLAVATAYRPAVRDGGTRFERRMLDLVPAITGPSRAPQGHFDVFVIEDAHVDLGALRSLKLHLRQDILPDLVTYLEWVAKDTGNARFLSFGASDVPAALDLVGIHGLLEALLEASHGGVDGEH